LHLGWAIEGAIGSQYKIDASYLSPHVNLASRLEAATKQYGVPLLISEQIHRYFSPRFQIIARKIDCVTLKGSKEPLGLYTIDLNTEDLPVSKNKKLMTKEEISQMNWLKKNAFLEGLESQEIEVEDVLDNDKSMKMLLKNFDIHFHEVFKDGIKAYLIGNWQKAKEKLEQGVKFKLNDGPCKTILEFMEKKNFIKPDDWLGFRELTEK